MIEQSAEIEKLAAALHAAQATVDGVKRTNTNPHFRNRYASLEAVIDTAKPALQANGIAFLQAPGAMVDGSIEITTMLLHTSGQWMRSTLHVPLTKRDAQGAGSAITYGCRYSLMAMLGLPPVDDDGEEASKPAPVRQVQPRQDAPSLAVAPSKPAASVMRDRLIETLRKATSIDDLAERANRDEEHFHALPLAMQAEVAKVYRFVEETLRRAA